MKILVLSCNTGQGHNSAANAIIEHFTLKGDECIPFDALEFLSKKVSEFLCTWHIRLYRYAPALFDIGYDYSERHPVFAKDAPVYTILCSGVKKLEKFVCAGGFDGIICTHPFASLMVTEMLSRYTHKNLKTAIVSTDYTCSPGVAESNVDAYFIPHKSLKTEFISGGVDESKIYPSGIPIKKTFLTRLDKATAKAKFGILPEQKHVLMMCGSIGCGPMAELVDLLSRRIDSDTVLTVICGKNEKLKNRLDKLEAKNVRALGYTDEVSLLMDSADIYLTKAGGISTTEACFKGLPMVFIDAVSGCEAHNRHFFEPIGFGFGPNEDDSTTDVCMNMLFNSKKLEETSKKMRDEFNLDPCEVIYDFFSNK